MSDDVEVCFHISQEEMIKTKVNRIIQDRKKMIYNSLTETIEETMQRGYKSKLSHDKTCVKYKIR